MQFFERNLPALHLNVGDSFFCNAVNDVQEAVFVNIANELIRISRFDVDIDNGNEIYVSGACGDLYREVSIDSPVYKAAIYYLGLSAGVVLGKQDIKEIINYLKYFVLVKDEKGELIDEEELLLEECL